MEMKKYRINVLLVMSLFLIISCNKDDVSDPFGYLIFGHFYGFCIGESCIQIYKLEKDKLFEDTKKEYPGYNEFYRGSYVKLDNTYFEQVKDLVNSFPEDLLNEQDTVFGCPDCADQGGLYIEYNFNGIHKFWTIDQFTGDVPVYLHGFMEQVNEKIDLINSSNN